MCKLHAQRTDFHRNFTQHFKRKFPNESQCIETKENILTFEYNNVHNVESSMPILYWIQNICWNATMNSKVNFSVNWCLYFPLVSLAFLTMLLFFLSLFSVCLALNAALNMSSIHDNRFESAFLFLDFIVVLWIILTLLFYLSLFSPLFEHFYCLQWTNWIDC